MFSSDGRGWGYDEDEEVIGAMGCHLTWMDLHGIDKRTLTLEKKFLEGRDADFETRPSLWLSLTNLLGFVYYSLGLTEDAEAKFDEVVAKDASNITALGNLTVIYRRQSRMKQYRAGLETLRGLLTKRDPVHVARSYADRAFALRHFQEHRRCFTYLSHISKAVQCAEGALTVPERAEWMYDYGLALHRRYMQMLHSGAVQDEQDTEQGMREVVECFHHVTRVEGVGLDLQALSWVFIGALLSVCPGKTLADALDDDTCNFTATDCFEKALELQPDNAEVLARTGAQFTDLKMYDRAKELLDRSLHKKESWSALRSRASLSMKMYEDQDQRETFSDKDVDELLQVALSDFTRAAELKETHADFSDLGYVYFLLKQPYKALRYFSNAVKSEQDDEFDLSVTHERWATCLASLGEEEGAAMQSTQKEKARRKMRQQATVLEDAWRHRHGVNCQGFECDLARFDYSSQDRPGYVNVLGDDHPQPSADAAHYVSRNQGAFKYDFFISFSHIDNKWSVALVRRLETEFNLKGNIRYRDYQLGAAIAENIAESVSNSFRTLIIMTPDSHRDQWCRYEVQRAHMTNLQRPCVVPIMLRPCLVPRELEHLTFIRCYKGQFRVEDWHRLGQSLCQFIPEAQPNWPARSRDDNIGST
ncbi:uncharacterized protein LOC110982592 isoform X2 [Acanthaster planci]|nr:uncharacterized protein LOC110982592 isoform X2 [Acanthaster planci]XP_022096816.1 uncharacterized protein LOC110982592 isoform X2 [Acanthaster planci]XP_022096817.1 uncharacterized protein LOC110982592 isoform X2 [Acanthaster planci]XP_022096818.1 uncharacterized protein LOC110982592 isoform X2 [Acanthaster planci]